MGRKLRPVLILTRPEVIDVRGLVTVAEITSVERGIAAEVGLDHGAVGLDRPSVVNCDGIHTVTRASLTTRVGAADPDTMGEVCWALNYALGC